MFKWFWSKSSKFFHILKNISVNKQSSLAYLCKNYLSTRMIYWAVWDLVIIKIYFSSQSLYRWRYVNHNIVSAFIKWVGYNSLKLPKNLRNNFFSHIPDHQTLTYVWLMQAIKMWHSSLLDWRITWKACMDLVIQWTLIYALTKDQ